MLYRWTLTLTWKEGRKVKEGRKEGREENCYAHQTASYPTSWCPLRGISERKIKVADRFKHQTQDWRVVGSNSENLDFSLAPFSIYRYGHHTKITLKSSRGDCIYLMYIFSPHTWNNLPQDIRHSATLSSFKSELRTFLFSEYFS